ncbi:bifunctional enoyl-CoA hydratase/phosphate acetyltransferase [Alterisphingorhabdus coralli]|uniref:Bifunctional enoyl-CoA hydratase/phosphate acetyltransferase n=1 Tax=Alterisphingorhabdus coralli TaxID=3071408 RepID=A0AA97F4X3_9SPHN|nr:bifunctional enoyl-CoA hydratase/phosphate acetyltransferase [Parasphingorhabdus sp. SCSIO 66989]WOE74291.1 bifunctional enoyl-CoA hydratase/phosphate acetyltransferase [Parasphingorhabdus sp. SCSIO 66989]
MNLIENKTYDELQVGDTASLSRTLTMQDIQIFAVMSGDVNPAHLDKEYAEHSRFREIIAHGMWGGSLISTLIGTKLPGPGTIYLSQTLKFKHPLGLGDVLDIKVTVKEKLAKNRVTLECICKDQDDNIIISGEAVVLAPGEKIRREQVKLPIIALKEEESDRYQQLIALTDNLKPLKTAVVHPVEENSLGGALEAAKDGLIEPILVGPQSKIEAAAEQLGEDISGYTIIATKHSHEAAERAVELVHEGQAEALMKGKLHTDELMHPIVDKAKGLRTGRRMSHIFALDAPSYHKPLFLTDAALNIRPSLSVKKDIVQNAIDLFRSLTNRTPKVALLSAVETVNENIPSTLDATALCKMAERGQIVGAMVDGPLAMDNAISKAAAEAKGIVSQVAGDADILVVPDIESGNILYKQMRFLSGVDGAGIVLGARVPVILTSRASGPQSRKASCALALISYRAQEDGNG